MKLAEDFGLVNLAIPNSCLCVFSCPDCQVVSIRR